MFVLSRWKPIRVYLLQHFLRRAAFSFSFPSVIVFVFAAWLAFASSTSQPDVATTTFDLSQVPINMENEKQQRKRLFGARKKENEPFPDRKSSISVENSKVPATANGTPESSELRVPKIQSIGAWKFRNSMTAEFWEATFRALNKNHDLSILQKLNKIITNFVSPRLCSAKAGLALGSSAKVNFYF